MLIPEKHMNLDLSLLRVSSVLLKELKKRRIIRFEDLKQYSQRRLGVDAELILLPAVNFLFLLGLLEYHVKNDSFEYLELGVKSAT